MTRIMKRIICMTIVILLVIACASPAFADMSANDITPAVKQRFGAWVASALMAGQILVQSVAGPAAQMYSWLSDPLDVTYQYTDTYYQEWMDKNKIVIDGNHVQIDGEWYDNVWLSHDAADKFRTNALDLKTAFNIANNSNGILAEGAGHYYGIPVFRVGSHLESQKYDNMTYNNNYNIGDIVVRIGTRQTETPITQTFPNGTVLSYYFGNYNSPYFIKYSNEFSDGWGAYIGNANNRKGWYRFPNGFDNTPFEYDWVAQEIQLDPLPANTGMSILVPHEDMEPFYNNYPDFNPQINPEINIDVDAPEFPDIWNMVDDLVDIISTALKLLPNGQKPVTYEEEPEPAPKPPIPDPDPYPDPEPEPYPDPDPEPGTPLPDIDWTDLFNTIKNIYDAISQGNVIKQVIGNINTDIRNIVDNIKWQIQQLRDQLGDIADKIIHGNKDWFSDIVDAIKAPFLPWITAFKSGVGIWHYVVEWIGYITEPFTFFFQTAREINYHLVLPVYALIAGTIVIAIYRRFGR